MNNYLIITKNNSKFLTDKKFIYKICLDNIRIMDNIPIKFNKGYLADKQVFINIIPTNYSSDIVYGQFRIYTNNGNKKDIIFVRNIPIYIYENMYITYKKYYELLTEKLNDFVKTEKEYFK